MRVRLAISERDLRAELTASELGKRSSSSGSSTITFERLRNCSAYLPLTSFGKSELLYYARNSSEGSLVDFFINTSFRTRRWPSADDPYRIVAIHMRHDE